MNSKDIEARLDRSLRRQVAVPKLDARFNAAVWDRIAGQESRAAAPQPARGSRWLLASNAVGVVVSLTLVAYFLARNVSGIDVEMNVAMPEIPEHSAAAAVKMLGWGVTAASVAFGLAFTHAGRRWLRFLRSEFA